MKKILNLAIPFIIEALLKSLSPKKLEKIADRALDWCEKAIAHTDSDYDDKILLPLIALIRETFSIEDNND